MQPDIHHYRSIGEFGLSAIFRCDGCRLQQSGQTGLLLTPLRLIQKTLARAARDFRQRSDFLVCGHSRPSARHQLSDQKSLKADKILITITIRTFLFGRIEAKCRSAARSQRDLP